MVSRAFDDDIFDRSVEAGIESSLALFPDFKLKPRGLSLYLGVLLFEDLADPSLIVDFLDANLESVAPG